MFTLQSPPSGSLFTPQPAEFAKKPAPLPEEEKKSSKPLYMGVPKETKPHLPPTAVIMEEGKSDHIKTEHIPKISLEELRSMGMNTKTIEGIFNKWRSGLVGLANEMQRTEGDMQQYEEKLLSVLKGIHHQLQVADIINKITEQQKQALIIIRKDQDKLDKMLEDIVVSVEPYLKQSAGRHEMGGREEIVRKIEGINARLEEIEQNIKLTKDLALETNRIDELEESEKNVGKYLRILKVIEGNIAELKYQIETNSAK